MTESWPMIQIDADISPRIREVLELAEAGRPVHFLKIAFLSGYLDGCWQKPLINQGSQHERPDRG